jgi:DNA-binding CsgD family transcriptional regulator
LTAGAAPRELLERTAELSALATLLDNAVAGSGGAVLIEGEAGVGKTALLERACEQAVERGVTVLAGRGGELEREFAWGVVRQLFEPWLPVHDQMQPSTLLTGSASLAGPVFGGDAAPHSRPEEWFATLHGLYWLMVNMTSEAPLLVAVDDLHWADRPSLRFAVYLASRLEGLPVLLLATMRPVGSEAAADTDLLARLIGDRGVEHLRPAPLSQGASSELVHARLSAGASPEFCLACHQMSGGNPFLLGALLDSVQAEGTKPTAESAAQVRRMRPSAVSRSVLVRLATLPEGSLDLARAVAVLGPRAEVRQARLLAGLDTDHTVQVVDALVRAGILRCATTVEFVHPLVRSAVYSDLAPAERGRWHIRAAELQAADGAPVEETAPHLLASLPDGNPVTVQWLREAAAQARARGAPELAVDYLSRALAEPPVPASRAEVLLELGAAEALTQPDEAVSHLRQALDRAATPELRATVALTLGDTLAATGRQDEALPVFDRGLRDIDGQMSELQAHLEAAMIAAARWAPSAQSLRHEKVRELQARAASGTPLDPLLRAQLAIETAAAGTDRCGAIEHSRQVLQAAPGLTLGASTVPEVALVLTFAGLPEEAWPACRDCLARARQAGWPLGIATASTSVALTALHLGWISEAIASARGAIIPGGDIPFASITVAFLVEALVERGDTTAANNELTRHGLDGELPLTWPTTPLLLARGRLRAAAGDHLCAIEDLLAVGDRVATWGLANPAMTPYRSSAAVSLAAIGEKAEAVRLANEELELARRWGTARAIGVAQRALGLAHGAGDGVELLIEATRTLQDAPAPVEHARALVDLGAALRRQGARSQSREQLRRGLDLAHRYGALALSDRAREELVIAGARPRRNAIYGRDALTSSELRVARFAAEGRTNSEIAQLLFITPRTVETHLTSSYAKLGIRSRRELAGVLDPPASG